MPNVFSQFGMEISPPGVVPWHSCEEFVKDREPWHSWPVWGQPEGDHGYCAVPCSVLPVLVASVDEATYRLSNWNCVNGSYLFSQSQYLERQLTLREDKKGPMAGWHRPILVRVGSSWVTHDFVCIHTRAMCPLGEYYPYWCNASGGKLNITACQMVIDLYSSC